MGLVSILEGLAGFFAPYLAFSENYAIVYSLYAAFSLAGWLVSNFSLMKTSKIIK